jgi:signal transduction histidine kinase
VAWRRRPWPLLAATAVSGPLVFEAIADLKGATSTGAAAWWYDAAVAVTAIALALPQRRGAAATGLVVDLATTPQALRAALARAVGDPGLEVAYRVGGTWVDEAARPVELPVGDAEHVVSVVEDGGEPIAALVHDRAALQDEALARSVAAALRLALANVRLQADVAARVREVELSRRRLVEAGAAERRRLREQLRAGAELHLEAAAAELDATGDAALYDELAAGRADLRRFAQGIHPRSLTEEGLEPALRELTAQSAVPIELDVPQQRFPAPQETVAFFVCSEALANAAKHAPGARVRVAVAERRGQLVVRVEDDGPGGADGAPGFGLRGLADRVEAFGGRLTVRSPLGSGTVLTAELPLRSEVAA